MILKVRMIDIFEEELACEFCFVRGDGWSAE